MESNKTMFNRMTLALAVMALLVVVLTSLLACQTKEVAVGPAAEPTVERAAMSTTTAEQFHNAHIPLTLWDAVRWGSSNIFNVQAYGAKGDGQADDYFYIALALQDASDHGGGVIFFPAGTYKIGTTLKVPANVALVGEVTGNTPLSKLDWAGDPLLDDTVSAAIGASAFKVATLGSTTDDAYVNMVLAVTNSGNELRLIEGYYGVTSIITVEVALGFSPSTTTTVQVLMPIIEPDTDYGSNTTADDISIVGLEIDGNDLGCIGVDLRSSSNSNIQQSYIHDCDVGVRLFAYGTSQENTIRDSQINDNNYGLWMTGQTSLSAGSGANLSYVESTMFDTNRTGVYIEKGKRNAFFDVHFASSTVADMTDAGTGNEVLFGSIDGGASANVVAGDVDHSGDQTYSGAQTFSSNIIVSGATALATAVPAAVIDNLAAGSIILDLRDAATPVFSVYNGGSFLAAGAGTFESGLTTEDWVIVSAPTTIATATPAFVVDSLGVSNIVELRDATTAVAYWDADGAFVQIGALTTGGSATTGVDVTFLSDTSGDTFLYDASEAQLLLTGTTAATAMNVADGNVVITLGSFDVAAGATTLEATTFGVNGTGADVIFYSDTSDDLMTWDTSEEALVILGTSAQDALTISEGNVTLTLGGLDVAAGATTLEVTTFGVSATGADVIFHSATAADQMTWDSSEEALIIEGTNGQDALTITDGNITLTDDLNVDGSTDFDGTVDIAGTLALASDVTLATDATGGNAGAKTEYYGLPRIALAGLGTMANGTTNTTIVDIGDSETPATDWVANDGDTVMSNDSSIYRQGTASLKFAISAAADDGDGPVNTLGSGDQDWTDDESFGFWMRSSAIMVAGDLQLVIFDTTAAPSTAVNLPAVDAGEVDIWQWVELDVTLGNNNLKDVITDLSITLSAAGAARAVGTGAWDVYFDFFVKWDAGEEEGLGQAIPYDGVMSLMLLDVTSAAASSSILVLYTDYFIHYQSGSDAIVIMTDQSDADKIGVVLLAY